MVGLPQRLSPPYYPHGVSSSCQGHVHPSHICCKSNRMCSGPYCGYDNYVALLGVVAGLGRYGLDCEVDISSGL